MNNLIVKIIELYQKTLSPDHSWLKRFYPYGYCRYYPTCSEYCKQAFKKYNIFKSLILCLWRLLRCNPLSKGGHDPVK